LGIKQIPIGSPGRSGIVKSKTWDDEILAGHRDYLQADCAKEAFDALVRTAIDMRAYETEPGWHGEIRDFKYFDAASGEQPFAFIVNRKDLLFHVRAQGLRRVAGGLGELKRRFSSAAENSRGEWRVRIASKEDAERLSAFLFSTPTSSPEAAHYWWVNHSQTFRQELDGGYLWSPKESKKSANSESCNNMTRVMPGDVVYSFADAAIRAVGMVLGRAHEAPKPAEFGTAGVQRGKTAGWQVSVRFRELDTPLRPKDHAAELAAVLPKKHSPIRASGYGNQGGYLAAVPWAMAAVVRRLLGPQADHAERKIKESVGPDFLDDIEEARIQQRADLGPVAKETLIRARRGHGRYRQDLEKVESGCRLTGLIDRRHLRATHIKPWCVSSDEEKLDPNNGLMLSPHIDHLFDRGYISFTDQGELLVSKFLNPVVLSDWKLKGSSKPKPFSAKQCVYLDYHRNHVFENHGRGKESGEGEASAAENRSVDIVLREIIPGPGGR
jgi:hypothetical protein